jgi:hypothetical protein
MSLTEVLPCLTAAPVMASTTVASPSTIWKSWIKAYYFENGTIRVDMGKGANNLHVAMERVVIGGSLQDRANGTLPHVHL